MLRTWNSQSLQLASCTDFETFNGYNLVANTSANHSTLVCARLDYQFVGRIQIHIQLILLLLVPTFNPSICITVGYDVTCFFALYHPTVNPFSDSIVQFTLGLLIH